VPTLELEYPSEKEIEELDSSKVHTWQNDRVVSHYRLRRVRDTIIAMLVIATVALVLYPLADILVMFGYQGAMAVSIPRLTQTTSQGGLADAMFGTLLFAGLSGLIAIPIGVLGGIYLAEFSGPGRFGGTLRFVVDVLAGVPSIVLGYVGFLILILDFGWGNAGRGGSLLAGAIMLAVLMLPYIIRTTQISMEKVPRSLREAAIALGSTKTQVINKMAFSLALPGIMTGIILSMSIAIGETTPLLITQLSPPSNFSTCLVNCPANFLTYIIWTRASASNGFDASLGSLSVFLIIVFVVALNLVARIGVRRLTKI
jgi:phosphate transport system permease protein